MSPVGNYLIDEDQALIFAPVESGEVVRDVLLLDTNGADCCCSNFVCGTCCSSYTEGVDDFCYSWQDAGPTITSAEILGFFAYSARLNPRYRINPDIARLEEVTLTQIGASTIVDNALNGGDADKCGWTALCSYDYKITTQGEPIQQWTGTGQAVSSDLQGSYAKLGPGREPSRSRPLTWKIPSVQDGAQRFDIGLAAGDPRGAEIPNYPDEGPGGSSGELNWREGSDNHIRNVLRWAVFLSTYTLGDGVCDNTCRFCNQQGNI